ncbi:Alpha/Beta hydrolase protein [Xylariomycetidae sp. FL2044]|nr:Alpha/Beta hydrolase protein [Xylariomycetidae sp. FL2044]
MKSFVFHPASGSRMRYLEFLLPGTANDTTTTSPPPPPLLMLHGLGCASSFEYPHVALAPALRHHQHQRRIVLLDLPGYGYSDRPADFGYGVPDLAAAVVTFVEARLLLPPAPEDPAGVGVHGVLDIYGHSMGGSVAVEVADRLGAAARVRVRALVLSEANLDAGGSRKRPGHVARRVPARRVPGLGVAGARGRGAELARAVPGAPEPAQGVHLRVQVPAGPGRRGPAGRGHRGAHLGGGRPRYEP